MKNTQTFGIPWGAILIAVLLSALSVTLNYSALSGYWRWDDPSILLHLHTYSVLGDFTVPEIWQTFSPANLTPWLGLSFEVDLILFGLNAELFYGHQIIAIALAAFSLYCLLGLWIRNSFAFLGACMFLTGTPSLLVAQQLMTRHYIEGLIFCLFSLMCFVLYLRDKRKRFLVLSALLYLLAVTAKEIYVPLVLLCLFIPESNAKSRLIASVPNIAIASIYTLWRAYMLDDLGGGYIGASSYLSLNNIANIIGTFLNIPQLMFKDLWVVAAVIYTFLFIAATIYQKRVFRHSLFISALVFAPLVPLVSFPGIAIADRYLLLPWVLLCFSVAVFCAHLSDHFMRKRNTGLAIWGGVIILFSAASLNAGLQTRSTLMPIAKAYDIHGEFIWENSSQQFFQPSPAILASYWFVTDLSEFKSNVIDNGAAPKPIVDYFLAEPNVTKPWVYQAQCQCFVQETQSIADLKNIHLNNVDPAAALNIEYEYRAGYFDWKFGPHQNGQYHIVSEVLGLVPAPSAGSLRVNVDDNTAFYLRYTSPEGWTTYSDELIVTSNAPATTWERMTL